MSEGTTEPWVLPEATSSMLADAYSAYRDLVHKRAGIEERQGALDRLALVASAGREKGWPYPEMATACDITAERLRQIVAGFTSRATDINIPEHLLDAFPAYVKRPHNRAATTRKTRRSRRATLTDAEIAKLQELAPLARQTSGSTPLNSPIRNATVQFSKLIIKYHSRGVNWGTLAQVTGLTESGVRSRAARHGYRAGPPPSIPAYRGTTIYKEAKRRKRENRRREGSKNVA